jgi:hypothetical protein
MLTKTDIATLERIIAKTTEMEFQWFVTWLGMGRPAGFGLAEYMPKRRGKAKVLKKDLSRPEKGPAGRFFGP